MSANVFARFSDVEQRVVHLEGEARRVGEYITECDGCCRTCSDVEGALK